MSHRVNILISDDTWQALQQIPRGERSRFIDRAITDQLLKQHRLKAIEMIDETRKRMQPVTGTAEQWIRDDRDRHE